MSESVEFITIDLSRKQIDTSKLVHNDKTNKDYARVFAPGGGSFLYPVDSIKINSSNPDRVYFKRPVGTEIQVKYSRIKEGVSADAPNNEKYETEIKTWKIEDLAAAYKEERKNFAEKNSAYVNMMVPTSWGKPVSNEKGNFISISIPIDKTYYSFLLPQDRFKPSDHDEGMSYFGFPRQKKDSEEDYTIILRSGSRNDDGTYSNSEKTVSSQELKKYVEDALKYSDIKNMFVSTVISDKLVRPFSSKDGKELLAVSVPVLQEQKTIFYEIVIPSERGQQLNEGKVKLSLFKNGTDGNPYVFKAKASIPGADGEYSTREMTMTASDVIDCFESSRDRYLQDNQNEHQNEQQSDHSLADELGTGFTQVDTAQTPSRRGSGRKARKTK